MMLGTGGPALFAAPLYQAASMGVQRDVTYCTAGGVDLKMDVFTPAHGGKPAPAVLYIHGGSWIGGDKYELGKAGEELARRGYVAASINYRLAPQYKWPAQIQDAKCAVRYLRANAALYNLDPNRIAAWGSSAGAHLAALATLAGPEAGFDNSGGYLNQSSRVQAVVDMFGPADLTAYNPDEFAAGVGQAVFGYTKGGDPSVLVRASPVNYVTGGAPPFLILHGDKDTIVPLAQSQELYNKLRAAGDRADLVVVKNAEHAFVPRGGPISPSLEEITSLIMSFFDRTVGNAKGTPAQPVTPPTTQLFPETGKTAGGRFLQYWQEHGGLTQFGYPITEEMQEKSEVDGKLYTVQYFERAVMELHPENSPPTDVLLALLGALQYREKYPNGAPGQVPNAASGSALFAQTGKRIGGGFLDYWRQHGGLAQFGYPISDEFREASPVDGKSYTVQYFERAVFELHPENTPPYNILLSPLGTLRYKEKAGGPKR